MGMLSRLVGRSHGEEESDDPSFASGELEYERIEDDDEERERNAGVSTSTPSKYNWKLLLAFCALILSGTANFVFTKLQTVPMYNYPNFLNFFGCLLFIPVCFIYILPVAFSSSQAITWEHMRMSKSPFAIMGALDCLALMMQTFAAVYLPGTLVILLPQAAIPFSMIFSRHFLKAKYTWIQYCGALVVMIRYFGRPRT